MYQLARALVVVGLTLAAAGALLLLAQKLNLPLGRLPGDIVYRGRHTTVYVPWVTMLIVSAALTILLNLFRS